MISFVSSWFPFRGVARFDRPYCRPAVGYCVSKGNRHLQDPELPLKHPTSSSRIWLWVKNRYPKWLALVSGNMDQNMRSNSWWFNFDKHPYGGWKKSCMTFVQIHSILLQLTPRPLINIGAQFGQVGLGHARFRSLATYDTFARHSSMLSRGRGVVNM